MSLIADASSPSTFRLSPMASVHAAVECLLQTAICCVAIWGFSTSLDLLTGARDEPWLQAVVGLVAIAWTTYSVMLKKSVRLLIDDNGVWLQSGVLPWRGRRRGLRWADVRDAAFVDSYWGRKYRSYPVRVLHRYPSGAHIVVKDLHRGDLAIEHINQVLARLRA